METLDTTLVRYEDTIRKNLKVKNPALLKTGVLGTLVNIMSNIKYDTASFYQKIVRELNPATAEDFNSLLFHSTILDYNIEYAYPSESQINIIIPEITLRPTETQTFNIDKNTVLRSSDGFDYTLEEDIKIYMTNDSLSAERINSTTTTNLEINKILNPLNSSQYIYLIEYSGLRQYKREFNIFYVPEYEIGEDIYNSINIESYKDIYEVNVYLQTFNNDLITVENLRRRNSNEIPDIFKIKKLNVKYNKFNASQFDNDIYLNILQNQLVFNLGNGINGDKLNAGDKLIFEIKTTKGTRGNTNQIDIVAPDIEVNSIDGGGYSSMYYTNVKMLSSSGGQNGKNLDNIFNIRNKMIKKSNARNSIVSVNDFQTEFEINGKKPFVDIKYFNSKNNIFLYNILLDNNRKIINTTTLVQKENDFATNLFFPEYTYNNVNLISPFYYKKRFNYYVSYMVKPLIEVELMTNLNTSTAVLLKNNVNLQITYDYFERKTKIRLVNHNSLYLYRFISNILELDLNKYNNFEQVVNQRFLDKYCLFEEDLKDIRLTIYDNNDNFVLEYYSPDIVQQLVEKQKHFTYSELNRLNASIVTKYVLNLPYIDIKYFKTSSGKDIYTKLDAFFNVSTKTEKFAFNMEINQSFFNTIDLPTVTKRYLVKSNNNGELLNSKNSIILNVIIDKYKYSMSNISSVEELEFKIKALTYGLLKMNEGFEVDFYETSLEKLLYDNINIFKNIDVLSPKAFSIYNSQDVYDNMEKDLNTGSENNLKIIDLVKYVPTYFHYDYDNMRINIEFV